MSVGVGDQAPEINLKNSLGKRVRLSDFRGKRVIVYFYPKDNTPGCTLQAQAFRDAKEALAAHNVVVLGISKDSVSSHERFAKSFDLNFDLLSDEDLETCQAYAVYKEKSMFGKKYMGIERSTFLIDEEGRIVKCWRKVKIKGHVAEIIERLS